MLTPEDLSHFWLFGTGNPRSKKLPKLFAFINFVHVWKLNYWTKKLALLELIRILKFPDCIFYGQGANQQIAVFKEELLTFLSNGAINGFRIPSHSLKTSMMAILSVPPFLDRHIGHASLSICCLRFRHLLISSRRSGLINSLNSFSSILKVFSQRSRIQKLLNESSVLDREAHFSPTDRKSVPLRCSFPLVISHASRLGSLPGCGPGDPRRSRGGR